MRARLPGARRAGRATGGQGDGQGRVGDSTSYNVTPIFRRTSGPDGAPPGHPGGVERLGGGGVSGGGGPDTHFLAAARHPAADLSPSCATRCWHGAAQRQAAPPAASKSLLPLAAGPPRAAPASCGLGPPTGGSRRRRRRLAVCTYSDTAAAPLRLRATRRNSEKLGETCMDPCAETRIGDWGRKPALLSGDSPPRASRSAAPGNPARRRLPGHGRAG